MLLSRNAIGEPGDGPSSDASFTADGTRMVFTSSASNLVPGDVNGRADVFVRDLRDGSVRRITGQAGQRGGGRLYPGISEDGSTVVLASTAALQPGAPSNGAFQVFVHDLAGGRNELLSAAGGQPGNDESYTRSSAPTGSTSLTRPTPPPAPPAGSSWSHVGPAGPSPSWSASAAGPRTPTFPPSSPTSAPTATS